MTEQQINSLFADRRCLEAELAIMQICSDELMHMDQAEYFAKCNLLKQKIAVTDHLLRILNDDERYIVQKHMIDGLPWSSIMEMVEEDAQNALSYDKRSLQRIQARALRKMHGFLQEAFADSLDFLVHEKQK